jgi:hypothetical protein
MDNQDLVPESYFNETSAVNLLGGNPLCLPQNYTQYSGSKELLAKSIFYYYLKNKHDSIVFSSYVEGFNGQCFFFADEVVKICTSKYKIPVEKFVMMTGCFPSQSNLQLYKDHCRKYNFHELRLVFVQTYEHMASVDARKNIELINANPLMYPKKQKPFLCFNGMLRAHRVIFIGELFARNLHPYTFLSAYDVNFMDQVRDTKWVVDQKIYSDRFYKLFYELETRKEMFPCELSQPEGQTCTHDYSLQDHNLYNRSYISVVTETDYFQMYHGHRTISMNCTFGTEKTYKPIKARHPFIIVSRPHFLKHLKQLGYKTFHPHINESYDDIENDEKRMDAILTEMERLAKYNEHEWGNFLYHTNHICQHNFDTLVNKTDLVISDVQ